MMQRSRIEDSVYIKLNHLRSGIGDYLFNSIWDQLRNELYTDIYLTTWRHLQDHMMMRDLK
jgi:hypothetical protein